MNEISALRFIRIKVFSIAPAPAEAAATQIHTILVLPSLCRQYKIMTRVIRREIYILCVFVVIAVPVPCDINFDGFLYCVDGTIILGMGAVV